MGKKDCCRVRSCNAEGQEWPGQVAPFPYAYDTQKTKGVVKRKPVFAYDRDFTCGLLAPLFEDIGDNGDYERLTEEMQEFWCEALDACDLEAIDPKESDLYVDRL